MPSAAEVHGLDLSDGVSDALVEDLQSALARYRMIAVRDQLLSVSDFSRLARRFGPFSGNPIHVPLDGFEDVVKGVREADDTGPNLGGQWHMDLAWFEAPPALTLLYAEETPPAGGDTLFADLRSAFGALSPGMQALTSDLVSVHSARNVYATNAAVRAVDVQADARATSQVETEHPLVCRHPLTDRPHLFVSSTIRRFKGMTEEESRPIVDFLLQHAVSARVHLSSAMGQRHAGHMGEHVPAAPGDQRLHGPSASHIPHDRGRYAPAAGCRHQSTRYDNTDRVN